MELKKIENRNVIESVKKNSIAEELGIEEGDLILSINNNEIEDIIEFRYFEADDYVEIEIEHKDGEIVTYEIEKDYDEEIGIEFSNPIVDSVKSCNNKCIFCFIDQLPEGMRETLYIKDDDSRLSFLQGNFITMTNMKDRDIDKMILYRISPVNISVHTTNPELRVKMLNNKFAGDIEKHISKLSDAKIFMNGQIVCIPDVNDKLELEKTIRDLAKYYPQMQSVAVVPVGLTKHRENLEELKLFDEKSSLELIEQIENLQNEFEEKIGTRFVFASDEFFVTAKKTVPELNEYENFIQLENGVGLMRKFQNEVEVELLNFTKEDFTNSKITIATGRSAFLFMRKIAEMIMSKFGNLQINVVEVRNYFFGETITVAGLLTGGDLAEQLKNVEIGNALFLPRVMFRGEDEIFLDDVTLEELEKRLDTKIVICEVEGKDLINNILRFRS